LKEPFLPRTWLLATSLTFVLGAIAILAVPRASSGIWDAGFACNVAFSLAFGLVVGWSGRWIELPLAVVYGAIVVLVGTDLVFAAGHASLVLVALIDLPVFLVAVPGVAVLLLAGAVAGWLARLLRSRCRLGCLSLVVHSA
jgi:hypothetical protein